MGQKIRPYGFRVGVTKPWRSTWYAGKKDFGTFVVEDSKIRKHIAKNYRYAAIPAVEIERKADNKVTLIIHSAKPGMLISKKTNRLSDLEKEVSLLTNGKTVDVRVKEVMKPETDAQLAAERIAEQLERRGSYKRAVKREIDMIKSAGTENCKVQINNHLSGTELSHIEKQV